MTNGYDNGGCLSSVVFILFIRSLAWITWAIQIERVCEILWLYDRNTHTFLIRPDARAYLESVAAG